jgi:hypothetical protein
MNPWACAFFLIAAFVMAGVAQTAWFATEISRRFAIPLDCGRTLRGHRVLGDNKTLRGFVVMVPAAALAFSLLALAVGSPESIGLWRLSTIDYAGLGACAGLGFMAGELPNSFVKRQFGIEPGAAASSRWGAAVQFAADRLDSGIGMLLAVSSIAPTPALTWVIVLAVGPAFHLLFSVVMFHLRLKARPA